MCNLILLGFSLKGEKFAYKAACNNNAVCLDTFYFVKFL